jgi:hypothetical protein
MSSHLSLSGLLPSDVILNFICILLCKIRATCPTHLICRVLDILRYELFLVCFFFCLLIHLLGSKCFLSAPFQNIFNQPSIIKAPVSLIYLAQQGLNKLHNYNPIYCPTNRRVCSVKYKYIFLHDNSLFC